MKRLIQSFLAVCLVVFSSPLAHAMLVLQLNLEQLTSLSERVFVGKCIESSPGRDAEGRPVVDVTYEVSETLKGPAEIRVSFRQLSPVEAGGGGGRGGLVVGQELPRYAVGEESVVFLSADGRLGLTAPVGFGQGKFDVISLGNGKAVRNAAENAGLFARMNGNTKVRKLKTQQASQAALTGSGDLNYSDFVSAVRGLAHP